MRWSETPTKTPRGWKSAATSTSCAIASSTRSMRRWCGRCWPTASFRNAASSNSTKEAPMNAWLIVLSLLCAQSAVAKRAAREVVEAFGREALEAAEPRVARLIEAYGEEVVPVLRKVGPSGVQAMERFGAPGLKILGRWGDDGVRLLAVEGEAAVAS